MITVESLDASHATEFHSIFHEVFGSALSPTLADWKYGGGRGLQFGAFSEDRRMVAHCGITFRDALVEHRPRRVAQLGDQFGVRNKPGGLARRGSVFGSLLRHVLDQVPSAENPDALVYGFPSTPVIGLIERLGLGISLNVLHELTFLPSTPENARKSLFQPGKLHLERVTRFDRTFHRQANRLWSAMATDLGDGALGVRTADYLMYRYVRHPEHEYEIYRVIHWFGRTVGLAVCRRIGAELELMDLIASLANMSLCISTFKSNLSTLGVGVLKMWLLDRHAAHFSSLATNVVPLQFHQMVNHNSSGGKLDRFKNRWWLTSGDADYR